MRVQRAERMSAPMDNVEYARDFATRIVRRMGARVAGCYEGEDLAALAELRDVVDQALVVAVAGMRAQGCAWSVIGAELGMTRQSAHERFAPLVSVTSLTDEFTSQGDAARVPLGA